MVDPWKKYLGEKFIYLQLVIVWFLPILLWTSLWLQKDYTYNTGTGKEDGYVCYPYHKDQRVMFSKQQYLMLLVTEVLVFSVIALSAIVIFCRFKRATAHVLEKEGNNDLAVLGVMVKAKAKKKTLNKTMGLVVAALVLLRVPFFVIASINAFPEYETFDWYFRIAAIFYVARFSVMPFIIGISNRHANKAYSDVLTAITPRCFENDNWQRKYYNLINCCKK